MCVWCGLWQCTPCGRLKPPQGPLWTCASLVPNLYGALAGIQPNRDASKAAPPSHTWPCAASGTGADPAFDVFKLGEEMGFKAGAKLRYMALGQGMGPKAQEFIETGVTRGLWIMLQVRLMQRYGIPASKGGLSRCCGQCHSDGHSSPPRRQGNIGVLYE